MRGCAPNKSAIVLIELRLRARSTDEIEVRHDPHPLRAQGGVVSQRGIKRKIRDAKSEIAYLDRLDACGIAIAAHARGNDWQLLRQRLDEYSRFLEASRARIAECVRDLDAQVRKKP